MGAIGYFTKSKYIKGEYKPTELDKRKAAADFLLQAVGTRYTICFNKPVELKCGRSIKRANNNGYVYYVTEKAFEQLAKQYTYECDF